MYSADRFAQMVFTVKKHQSEHVDVETESPVLARRGWIGKTGITPGSVFFWCQPQDVNHDFAEAMQQCTCTLVRKNETLGAPI